MPHDLRQELLMPFLTRLAGTADRPEIEAARAKLIVFRSIRDIAPLKLRSSGLVSQARRCEQAEDFDAAVDAARNAADTILYILDFAARDAHYAATETRYVAADAVRSAAILCADFVGTPADTAAQTDTSVRRKLFTIGVSILDEAIRLGKQAEAVDNALVAERMEKIKQRLLMPRLRAPVCRRARSSV